MDDMTPRKRFRIRDHRLMALTVFLSVCGLALFWVTPSEEDEQRAMRADSHYQTTDPTLRSGTWTCVTPAGDTQLRISVQGVRHVNEKLGSMEFQATETTVRLSTYLRCAPTTRR